MENFENGGAAPVQFVCLCRAAAGNDLIVKIRRKKKGNIRGNSKKI